MAEILSSFELLLCICTITHGGRSILIDPVNIMGQKIYSFFFFFFLILKLFNHVHKKTNMKLTVMCV